MTRADLQARWNERDRRYSIPRNRITPDMAAAVRVNRLLEIDWLESDEDRQAMLAILSAWHPLHEVTG